MIYVFVGLVAGGFHVDECLAPVMMDRYYPLLERRGEAPAYPTAERRDQQRETAEIGENTGCNQDQTGHQNQHAVNHGRCRCDACSEIGLYSIQRFEAFVPCEPGTEYPRQQNERDRTVPMQPLSEAQENHELDERDDCQQEQ